MAVFGRRRPGRPWPLLIINWNLFGPKIVYRLEITTPNGTDYLRLGEPFGYFHPVNALVGVRSSVLRGARESANSRTDSESIQRAKSRKIRGRNKIYLGKSL